MIWSASSWSGLRESYHLINCKATTISRSLTNWLSTGDTATWRPIEIHRTIGYIAMMEGNSRHAETATSGTIVFSPIPRKISGSMFLWSFMDRPMRLSLLNLVVSFLRKIETLKFVGMDSHSVVRFLTT